MTLRFLAHVAEVRGTTKNKPRSLLHVSHVLRSEQVPLAEEAWTLP